MPAPRSEAASRGSIALGRFDTIANGLSVDENTSFAMRMLPPSGSSSVVRSMAKASPATSSSASSARMHSMKMSSCPMPDPHASSGFSGS